MKVVAYHIPKNHVRPRARRVQAADDGGLPVARPVALPQPHVLVRHQRRLPRQGAGPGAHVPHRPRDARRQHVIPSVELRRAVRDALHAAHAGALGPRARALPAHARATGPRVLHGRAAGLGAEAAGARAQRVRAAPGLRHAGLHDGGPRGLQPEGQVAGARRVLPEGHQRVQIQAAGVLAGRAAGGRGQAHAHARARQLPTQPLRRQEEPVLVLVRHEARRLRAATHRQRGHHGLSVAHCSTT